MKEPEKLPSLEALDQSIRQMQSKTASEHRPKQQPAAQGLQIGMELAAGVLVGTGIGFAIDHVFGTTPLFLLVCMMFGFAGGMVNLRRALKRLADNNDGEENT